MRGTVRFIMYSCELMSGWIIILWRSVPVCSDSTFPHSLINGTALQTGSKQVRFPIMSLKYFNNIFLPVSLSL
jgi:hypothetical protein